MTHVYIIVPQGVSDKSAAGVFETRHEATEAAEALWKASDGYHSFKVECRRIGKTYVTFPLGHRPPTTKPPVIKQVNERDVEAGL